MKFVVVALMAMVLGACVSHHPVPVENCTKGHSHGGFGHHSHGGTNGGHETYGKGGHTCKYNEAKISVFQ